MTNRNSANIRTSFTAVSDFIDQVVVVRSVFCLIYSGAYGRPAAYHYEIQVQKGRLELSETF